jgi:hypothetical protein
MLLLHYHPTHSIFSPLRLDEKKNRKPILPVTKGLLGFVWLKGKKEREKKITHSNR